MSSALTNTLAACWIALLALLTMPRPTTPGIKALPKSRPKDCHSALSTEPRVKN